MKRLISTLNLSKEDWLRYRKCGITGTDAGAILGLNPYRSAFQVYHDKISDTIENIDNEAMRQGRDLEDYVAQRFTEATGLKVRRANAIYQSEEHPLLLADFDRLIVGQKAGLECKTVSPFSADKWADGKIPAHYMAQVNHYLAVSGFDCWYIAALIFGKELVIHKITTDKEVLNNLIAKEEHFWKYNVMPEIPPVPTGSEGDTQQINQLYSADDRNKTADLNPIRDLLDKRQELSDQIEQLEQEKASIEQQVKLEMQDAAYGTAPGYKVSWVSSESKRVDSQRLTQEQRAFLEGCEFKVYLIYPNGSAGVETISGMDGFVNCIKKSVFSKDSPGGPLFCTFNNVKDNSPVKVRFKYNIRREPLYVEMKTLKESNGKENLTLFFYRNINKVPTIANPRLSFKLRTDTDNWHHILGNSHSTSYDYYQNSGQNTSLTIVSPVVFYRRVTERRGRDDSFEIYTSDQEFTLEKDNGYEVIGMAKHTRLNH